MKLSLWIVVHIILFSVTFCLEDAPHYELHASSEQVIEYYITTEEYKSGDLSDFEKWKQTGNIANFLGFQAIRDVSITIPVNFILIGFEGDGNSGIRIENSYLEQWLEHIEHSVRHLTAPVGEDQTTTKRVLTPATSITYRLETHVIRLCPLVNTLVEDTLFWNVRPEKFYSSVDSHTDYYYVNSFAISNLLQSMLEFLNLSKQYNIILLNPNPPFKASEGLEYGYRIGFSNAEIELLQNSQEFRHWVQATPIGFQKNGSAIPNKPPPSGTREQSSADSQKSIKFRELVHESEEWARLWIRSKGNLTSQLNMDREKDDIGENMFVSGSINNVAKAMYANGTQQERNYISKILSEEQTHEECLVDAWVAHERFAFYDLTSGFFEWGPAIGGEGVKSKKSAVKSDFFKNKRSLGNMTQTIQSPFLSSQQQQESFQAEVDLLKSFIVEYCQTEQQRQIYEAFCSDIESQLTTLLDPSSATDKVSGILRGDEEEVTTQSHSAIDYFVAKLGVLMSVSVRHLITPPSSLFESAYHKRVAFTLMHIIVGDCSKPTKKFSFDVFKNEVSKLKLVSQEFTFSRQQICMSEDAIISDAFSSSLRTAMIPGITSEGEISSEGILYLDSKQLHYHLSHKPKGNEVNDQHDSALSYQIPIFFFQTDMGIPVFVDKYYSAKALKDMIIVVQSLNFPSWKSPISCNGKTTFTDLSNPLKSSLTSVALLLGGLVPTHVFYNDATKNAQQNWLWSVGDNPLSATSSGVHFNNFQKDVIHRNYATKAINQSVQLYNEAVEILLQRRTTAQNFQAKEFLPLNLLADVALLLKLEWVRISNNLKVLDFDGAVTNLELLSDLSKRFKETAQEIADSIPVFECNQKNSEDQYWYWIPLILAVDSALLALWYLSILWKKPKTKIN